MNTSITEQPAAPRVRCLHIEPHIYEALAQELVEKIGERNTISTTIEIEEDGDMFFRFSLSAVICWVNIAAPDGNYRKIERVVPVWWELHSFRGEREVLNDATFDEIKKLIIN